MVKRAPRTAEARADGMILISFNSSNLRPILEEIRARVR